MPWSYNAPHSRHFDIFVVQTENKTTFFEDADEIDLFMLKLGFWEMEMFGPVDWSFMKTEDTFKKRRCSFFGDSF